MMTTDPTKLRQTTRKDNTVPALARFASAFAGVRAWTAVSSLVVAGCASTLWSQLPTNASSPNSSFVGQPGSTGSGNGSNASTPKLPTIVSVDDARTILLADIDASPAAQGVAGSATLPTNGAAARDENLFAASVFVLRNVENDPEAIAVVELTLNRPEGDASARAMLRAIEREGIPSLRVFPSIASRATLTGPAELPALIGALGAFPTRDSARLILRCAAKLAATNTPGASRVGETLDAGSMAALRRLSGKVELGSTLYAWSNWLYEADKISESQWRLEIARAQSQRSQQLEADRATLSTRLVESLRRQHVIMPPDQRGALVAGMLRDSLTEVRDLGLDLASRELQGSGRLAPEVGLAAIMLLGSTDVRERTKSATIVRQVAPEGAGPAVAAALVIEEDPAAAGELMLAATRWPNPQTIARTLWWLEASTTDSAGLDQRGSARVQSLDATLILIRAAEMSIEDEKRVLSILRALAESRFTNSACQLLASLGTWDDRARLIPLLDSDIAAVRQGAADGLVWDYSRLDLLIASAQRHQDLFNSAVKAVMVNAPTAANYRKLALIDGASTESGRQGLAKIAELMAATDLAEISRETRDRVLKSDLLLLLTSPRRVQSEWADEANANAIVQGGIELARTRLVDGDVAGAAAVLAGLPIDSPVNAGMPGVTQAKQLRAVSVLALGRLDDELATQAPADVWIEALGYVPMPSDRTDLAREIVNRFGKNLTLLQRTKVNAVITAVSPIDGE